MASARSVNHAAPCDGPSTVAVQGPQTLTVPGHSGGAAEACIVFTGNANPPLAQRIAAQLNMRLAPAVVDTFPDGEPRVKILEPVSGTLAFVIQGTCCAEKIIEALLLADALKRARARYVVLVAPYWGYARQSHRQGQEPLSSALMARLLEAAGVDAVIILDLHDLTLENGFRLPVVHVQPTASFVSAWQQTGLVGADLAIASPDTGGIRRARSFCQALDASLIVLHKRRLRSGKVEVGGMSSEIEIRDRTVMLVDDQISTGETLFAAARFLHQAGAKAIYASATHLVLPDCLVQLPDTPIRHLFVSDSLLLGELPAQVTVVSVAPLLAREISRMSRAHGCWFHAREQ